MVVGVTVYVEPAPHEFAANYLFNERGLASFFAVDRRVKRGGGSALGTFIHDGEEWQARLYYQESGLQHPGDTTLRGTNFDIETLREYRLNVISLDDEVGQRKFNVHLAPRWPGMKSQSGEGIPVPDGFGEGVNIRVSGSNIEFAEYLVLIQRAFGAVDIRPDYFAEPHPYSNVRDAERYVRLHRVASGRVHARDGPIARLGHLLENDRNGYRKVVQNDQTERKEALPGYYHTVTLGQKRIQEAFPSHELPKEIKHYYARGPRRSRTTAPFGIRSSALPTKSTDGTERSASRRRKSNSSPVSWTRPSYPSSRIVLSIFALGPIRTSLTRTFWRRRATVTER